MFTEKSSGDVWYATAVELQEQMDTGVAAVRRELGRNGLVGVMVPAEGIPTEKNTADSSYRARGLCTQTDPETFFPEKGGSTREAKKICANCEVREDCLEDALARGEKYGVWGGMSERERRRLKKSLDT